MTGLNGLFSAKGRARRSEWWLLGLGLGLTQFALIAGTNYVLFGEANSLPGYQPTFEGLLVEVGWFAVFFWPVTALSLRRAHDRGGDGWLVWIGQLLIVAATLLDLLAASGVMPVPESAYVAVVGTMVVVGFALLITLGFVDGTPGENRFGPSPKADDSYRNRP